MYHTTFCDRSAIHIAVRSELNLNNALKKLKFWLYIVISREYDELPEINHYFPCAAINDIKQSFHPNVNFDSLLSDILQYVLDTQTAMRNTKFTMSL